MKVSDLSKDQNELLLYLGGTAEDDRVVSMEVLQELISLRIVSKPKGRPLDLTKLGDRFYTELGGK